MPIKYKTSQKNYELNSFGNYCRSCGIELTPKEVKKGNLCKGCHIQ